MKLTKVTKRVISLAMTVAVVASSIAVAPAPKKAEAASYKAYLCISTKKFNYRTNHNDTGKFQNYLMTEKDEKVGGTKFTDVTVKKSKKAATYTVKLTGLKNAIAEDGGWNTIYVDTSIPGTMRNKVKVSKLVVKFDGKAVKTIKNPTITPDPGKKADFTQIMALNCWNSFAQKKWKAESVTKMPKNSITVSFTIQFK